MMNMMNMILEDIWENTNYFDQFSTKERQINPFAGFNVEFGKTNQFFHFKNPYVIKNIMPKIQQESYNQSQ